MLLEIAICDAYGAGFEYSKPKDHRQNDLKQYYSHPKWRQLVGMYTDDTEMSIMIAELLVEKLAWNPKNIANKIVEVFQRNGQLKGYSGSFYKFLCSVNSGREFLDRIKPDSSKSGAAMRSNPLGILPIIDQVLEYAEIQARVTHNTDASVCSSQAIALMSHYFIYDLGPKSEVGAFLEDRLSGARFGHNFNDTWLGKVGEQGMESAHAAVQTVQTSKSMTEILLKCVDYSGDVDTVAAMAGGSACSSKEIVQDIPENLFLTLNNEEYGREFLIELDKKLMALKDSRQATMIKIDEADKKNE